MIKGSIINFSSAVTAQSMEAAEVWCGLQVTRNAENTPRNFTAEVPAIEASKWYGAE